MSNQTLDGFYVVNGRILTCNYLVGSDAGPRTVQCGRAATTATPDRSNKLRYRCDRHGGGKPTPYKMEVRDFDPADFL